MEWHVEIRCDVFKGHWNDALSCWVYYETFYVVAVKGSEQWAYRHDFASWDEANKLVILCNQKKSFDFVPSVWYWYRIYAKPLYAPKPWYRRKNWWIEYESKPRQKLEERSGAAARKEKVVQRLDTPGNLVSGGNERHPPTV